MNSSAVKRLDAIEARRGAESLNDIITVLANDLAITPAELMDEAQRVANIEAAVGWDATLALLAGEAGCTVDELVATYDELRAA